MSEKRGVHAPHPKAAVRYVDASENASKARQFLPHFLRSGKINAVVDFVSGCSRFRLLLPSLGQKIVFVLSGIRAPRTALKGTNQKSDPFGDEAATFVSDLISQRDVGIDIENVDKTGGFIGTLWFGEKQNLNVRLVEEGFATVFGAGNTWQSQLDAAEQNARQARKHVRFGHPSPSKAARELIEHQLWTLYDPEEEERAAQEEEAASGRQTEPVELYITEVLPNNTLYVQINGPGARELEEVMHSLQQMYQHSTPSSGTKYAVGQLVAANFTEDNGWYRARVQSVQSKEGTADILYVDYGNSEKIPFDRLRVLEEGYKALPAQAHEATLSHVVLPPPSSDYAAESLQVLRRLVTRPSMLQANIDRRVRNVLHLTVFEAGQDGLTMNEEFVRSGWGLLDRKPVASAKEDPLRVRIEEAEAAARKERLNIWEYGDFFSE